MSRLFDISFPIYVRRNGGFGAFCGTGFFIKGSFALTCYHVVAAALGKGEDYVACIVTDKPGATPGLKVSSLHPFVKVQRELKQQDIALVQVGAEVVASPPPDIPLIFEEQNLFRPMMGSDVWTMGYPRSGIRQTADRQIIGDLKPRMFKGHILRTFHNQDFNGPPHAAIELSFPATEGLSGAPLFNIRDQLIGMIYGNLTEQNLDGDQPQSLSSYGLAFKHEELMRASFQQTNGLSLRDWLPLS